MSLLGAMRERARTALASGDLEPIPTRLEILEEAGLRFVVRVVDHLTRKERAARDDRERGRDPFLPYEEALHVADLTPSHVALLNKYNVLPDHLLVVTRTFEEQESLLTRADFEALERVMDELDALFFYNAGPRAGASQRHKHLQFVSRESFPTPLEDFYGERGERGFRSAAARWRSETPARLREVYLELLEAIGHRSDPRAYNLLGTRDLLVAIPRSREAAEGISVNGLGFAGSLFVRSEDELRRLREIGPRELLRAVGVAR